MPPVELTTSKENPRGEVEEAVSTLPSAPERDAKAFVPEAIITPRAKVLAPLPPEETPSALVRLSKFADSDPFTVVVPSDTTPDALKLPVPVAFVNKIPCNVEVPVIVKFLVDDAHRKLASPANVPPLLYWIWVVAPPGVPPPEPQSTPVPVTTPFVSTCKHCVEPLIPEIVSCDVVALPVNARPNPDKFPVKVVVPKLTIP